MKRLSSLWDSKGSICIWPLSLTRKEKEKQAVESALAKELAKKPDEFLQVEGLRQQNASLQEELASVCEELATTQALAQKRLDRNKKLKEDLRTQQAAMEHRKHSAAVSHGATGSFTVEYDATRCQ